MDISAILENVDKSVLNEETAKAIAEAFEQAVNEKAGSRVKLELESALTKQDEDHAGKLQKLLEAIDTDHSQKLQQVVDAINENHTGKLEKLVGFYRKALNEKAEAYSNRIVEELSNYLDLYLEKKIPQTQLEEAVANTTARQQLQKIREIVSFDPSTLNEQVKSVISTGKQKIDDLQGELNESYKQNIELQEQVKSLKGTLVLEEKTKGMSVAKKEFVTKLLNDKTPEYITENFNYVVEMFEREESETSTKLVEEAKKSAISKDAKIPASTVVEESSTQEISAPVNEYLSALKGN
jgi:hypothetical protein